MSATAPCVGAPGALPVDLTVVSGTTGQLLNSQAVVSVKELMAPYDSVRGPLDPQQNGFNYLPLANYPGDYDVVVDVPGYQSWHQVVTLKREAVRCGQVIPVHVVIRIVPNP